MHPYPLNLSCSPLATNNDFNNLFLPKLNLSHVNPSYNNVMLKGENKKAKLKKDGVFYSYYY